MSARRDPYALEHRPMLAADIPAVMAIEQRAYSHPWTEGIFQDCLRVGYGCTVFEQCGVIDAYAIISLAAGECHVLNICVRPAQQGRGIGRRVLHWLLSQARQSGADTVFLEVRPSNTAAIQLYRSLGFDEVGRRRHYYPAHHGREDAVIMAVAI